MRKSVRFFSVFLCLLSLIGCSNQPKTEYDAVKMVLVLSSTTAGQPKTSKDTDAIEKLWTLCKENEDASGEGQRWEIQFISSSSNEEKIYHVYENQTPAYHEITEIYHQYFE